MVRMPALPIGKDDYTRACAPNHTCDLQAVLPRVLYSPVLDVERLPPRHFQNPCRFIRLPLAVFSTAASSHLAASQIENAGAMPALSHLQQGPAAGLLHVIAMRGDRQNVEIVH